MVRAPFRWRFRAEALLDLAYEETVGKHIDEYFCHNTLEETTISARWAAFKCYIRGICIGADRGVEKFLKGGLQRAELEIADLDEQYHASGNKEILGKILVKKEGYLSDVDSLNNVSGRVSDAKRYWQSEKPSTLLARLLTHDREPVKIKQILDDTGGLLFDTKDILCRFESFYSNLYRGDALDDEAEVLKFLRKINLPRLNEEQRVALDADITEVEIAAAVKDMAVGKAPGIDGISTDFYKHYAAKLVPKLHELYLHAFETMAWLPELNEALIVLLPKPNMEGEDCNAYRPLSLINCDIKILAKVLAIRYTSVVNSLIGTEQTGFVPGRSTAISIRRVFDVIAHSETESGAAVLSLDAQKAFDSVVWKFLFKILEVFGFGDKIVQWTRLLYTGTSARVLVNGFTSDRFLVGRGTRQGCPLSAVLFALVVEPLIRYLEVILHGSGLMCRHILFKVVMYADDLLLFLRNPTVDIVRVNEALQEYGKVSGYKINWNKTVLLVKEEGNKVVDCQLPLLQTTENFKYLGVRVAWTKSEWYDLNVAPLLLYLDEKIEKWQRLPISIAGRIAVIKMVILPKMLYIFENVPVLIPKTFFDQCRSKILRFIWNGRTPRVACSVLMRDYGEGGLALPDLYAYYIASQLKHAQKWFAPIHHEPQVEAEKQWFGLNDASSEICVPQPSVKRHEGPAALAVLLWKRVVSWSGVRVPYSPYIPIKHLMIGNDSERDKLAEVWEECGLSNVQDLFVDGQLRESRDILEQAGGGLLNVMNWMAIKRKMYRYWQNCPSEPTEFKLLTHMITTVPETHQISRIYKLVREGRKLRAVPARGKWEETIGSELDDVAWSDTCDLTRTISLNMHHRMIHYKFLHQTYVTPKKLNRMNGGTDVFCLGCGSANVDFVHTAWGCFKIQLFWIKVFDIVSEVCGCKIDNSLETALLNMLPKMNQNVHRWANIAITLAKRRIALNWMRGKTPSIKIWLRDLTLCANKEELALNLMKWKQRPKDKWVEFKNYLFQQTSQD